MSVRQFIDTQNRIRFVIDYWPNGSKGRHIVRRLPPDTTEDQARMIEKALRDRARSIQIPSASGNIARLSIKYLDHCRMHQSPQTVIDKESHFKTHIIPFFGTMHVDELTTAHIDAYKQQMQGKTYRNEPITNRTILKGLNYFSAFIKWCEDDCQIAPLKSIRFKRLPHARPVPVVLSLDEAMLLINSADKICKHASRCKGRRQCEFKIAYNIILKIFFYRGLRKRATRTLRWEDIDWAKHSIKTTEKGNKTKWHPLPDDLYEDLRALYIQSASSWIFPSPQDFSKPVNNLSKGIARARKKSGIQKRIYAHLLRHSIATHLKEMDVDMSDIQAFLGHSNISTTQFYAQVSTENKRRALEKAGIIVKKP